MSQTAVAVGVEPDNNLADNEYYEHFGPDYTLHVEPCNMKNLNSLKRYGENKVLFKYCVFCLLFSTLFDNAYYLLIHTVIVHVSEFI